MKRIFLLLAAVAAFASCVKENDLVPDQTSDNLVTITAVSADTKTTLDGVNVLWEENDAIAVVVEGESDKYLQTFTTSSTEKASTAEFTAVLSDELVADETVTGVGYAVYPAASATYEYGNVSITHELPVEQTGTITKGMNLSYAKVDADDIKEGKANAVFSNALTLLKVNVPEGVKSVVLESDIMSDALVGTVNFTVNKTADNISFVKGGTVSAKRTVTLSNGVNALEEGVHDLLVFPGTANVLTLTMTGMDDAVYESTLTEVEFVAGTYRTINLTKVFKMDVGATLAVNPTGEKVTVPVAATDQYTYTVDIEDNPSWISVETDYYVQTKAFVGTNIVFDVEGNTTGALREANVTITWNDGEAKSKSFVITQESAYLDFVYVDPANPESDLLQWQETFGVYADEACETEAKATISNVFTIKISDDFSKGVYMVINMFKDLNTGAKYYADYNVTTKKLTVYTSSAKAPSRTYYFADESVVLDYDPSAKTFTSEKNPIPAQTKYDFTGFSNKNCYLGNYSVAKRAVDPGSGSGFSSLYGTYNESVKAPYSYGSTETLVISESDNPSYDLKMLFFYTSGESSMSYDTAYGKVSGDGKTITVTIPGYSNFYGSVSDFVLTVNGNVISGSYCGNMDYSATKQN